ncbi:hypothetical protein EV182_007796, partial [Spiromyces aspiralis]
ANILGTTFFLFPSWMVDKWVVQPRFASKYGLIRDARYWSLGTDFSTSYEELGQHTLPQGTHDVDSTVLEEFDLELNDIIMDISDEEDEGGQRNKISASAATTTGSSDGLNISHH